MTRGHAVHQPDRPDVASGIWDDDRNAGFRQRPACPVSARWQARLGRLSQPCRPPARQLPWSPPANAPPRRSRGLRYRRLPMRYRRVP